ALMLAGLAHLPEESGALLRQKKALRNPWRGCEALVLIESVSGGAIAGLLVVGPKCIGGSLQRKDRSLLVTVAHLVGTAYANALLIQGLHVSLAQVQVSTNQLIAARAELQLLLRELVSAEERERSALARDLHDDALQEVLYVIRHAQFCTRLAAEMEASWRNEPAQVPGQPHLPLTSARAAGSSMERLRAELMQLADQSQVLERKLRGLCMGLYPEALRVLGLPTALEELAVQVTRTTRMDVSVYYDDDVARAAQDLLPERAVHLYRIAQEALTNAGKHANAASAMIYLSLLATLPGGGNGEEKTPSVLWLCLTIIDNGAGMPLPLNLGALVRSGHLGLAGMRERAEQLEGRLDIRREPSGGTRVMIMLPLTEHAVASASGNRQMLPGSR
ncbi:MAG TPA: ATP-binding protein, partial [Ktedonobacterales bacterium]|nr:ATP-binding protein [Ktedonobacterales bacterium]